MTSPSLLRLYLLRACYLLLFAGLAVQVMPQLLGPAAAASVPDGVVVAMLSALALCSLIGLFAPLAMLPVLLWEIAWKVIWSLSVALPRWQAGTFDDEMTATLFAVSWIVPFLFIFPWRYFVGTIAANLDRWR